jgi:membrane associated rhomboid family serine protease
MILLWFIFDIVGALAGGGGVAYVGHLAGFLAGFALALALLGLGWIEMEPGERSLLEVLSGSEK